MGTKRGVGSGFRGSVAVALLASMVLALVLGLLPSGWPAWAAPAGGGAVWETQRAPAGCSGLSGIWGTSSSSVYAVTYCGILIHYDGSRWVSQGRIPMQSPDGVEPYISDIWCNASDLFVLGGVNWHEHSVFRRSGGRWTQTNIDNHDGSYSGIWGGSSRDVFAVGGCDIGIINHYDGASWNAELDPDLTTAYLRDVWGSSGSDVFAVGLGETYDDYPGLYGAILHYDGRAWSSMSTIADTTGLSGVWGSSGSDVFAVGDAGTILHYNGSAWSTMHSGTTNDLRGVCGSSASDVFAVGTGGTILHYNGSAWSPWTSGTTKNLNAIWGSAAAGFFAVGDGGTILHYYDMPNQPVNVSPSDSATGVSLAPTLRGSAYADADGDAHVASRWQVRSSSGNYNSPVWDSGSSSAATSAMVPAGKLANSTTYFWRVGYQQAGGRWSSYSKETSFTTIEATAVAPTVVTIAASSIGSTSATLNLSLTSLGSAPSVQVSFEWGTGTAYGHSTTPETMTGTGSFSYPLSGLSPSTTYYFRAKADGRGTAYGGDMTLTTASVPVAPPTVTTNAATDVAVDAATLNGALTDLGSATAVQVSFQWGLTASYGNSTPPGTMSGTGNFSADLNGLAANTTYHYRARVMGDDTAYGSDMTFETRATPATPPSVATADADSVTAVSARLNGDVTSLGTAARVMVSFVWGTTQGGPYTNETAGAAQTAAGAFRFDLGGLASGTEFYYQAKAVGNGTSYGAERSFTTTAATAGGTPSIGSLVADNGRPGDELTVTIAGSNLSGATALSFGAGITINEFRVVSDTEITVQIAIASGAEAGDRDVTVTTAQGTGTAPGAFTVNEVGSEVQLWVYLVAVVGGIAVLGLVASLAVWLLRRPAKPTP